MFKVEIGEKGLENSHQNPFPKTVTCWQCRGEARIGFTAREENEENIPLKDQELVYHLHPNKPKTEGYWLHDCCSVAIYFCKKCFKATALWNQA